MLHSFIMPTAKTTTKTLAHADDAPRTADAPREALRPMRHDEATRDALDTLDVDPYDNIACTD